VSGSDISWAICRSALRSRQITTPAPHRSVFLQAGCPSCRPTNSVRALKAYRLATWGENWCGAGLQLNVVKPTSHVIVSQLSRRLYHEVHRYSRRSCLYRHTREPQSAQVTRDGPVGDCAVGISGYRSTAAAACRHTCTDNVYFMSLNSATNRNTVNLHSIAGAVLGQNI